MVITANLQNTIHEVVVLRALSHVSPQSSLSKNSDAELTRWTISLKGRRKDKKREDRNVHEDHTGGRPEQTEAKKRKSTGRTAQEEEAGRRAVHMQHCQRPSSARTRPINEGID